MEIIENQKHYDVIVVGAGNSGLAAALAAADAHKKVLVLERNVLPGGGATSFVRGRFEFEPSLHELCCVGSEEDPGNVRTFFEQYGIHINWVTLEDTFRVICLDENGYDVRMPAGIDAFYEKLVEIVPEAKESIKKMRKMVQKIHEAQDYFATGKRNPIVAVAKYRDFLKAASHSVKDILDYLEIPPKAQSIMSSYWPYLGSSVNELDSLIYLLMMESYLKQKPAIPYARSHELSTAIEKAITDRGGEIWYHTPAESLIYRDGKVCGVVANGQDLYADEVVSNAFPDRIYDGMLPSDAVPQDATRLVNARRYGVKFFTIYLGLNRSVEELGISDYTTIIYNSSDPEEQFRELPDYEKKPIFINFLNCAIPDASPKGTSIAYISTIQRVDDEDGITPENYEERKRELADILIRRCEEVLHINMHDCTEEIEICTPATFARYLGTPYGTPYGYELNSWDGVAIRTTSKSAEKYIKGLSFVGAHGELGDGYSSTYLSGRDTMLGLMGGKKKK